MAQKTRFPRARYTLPDVVNPPTTRCFQVEVPNNLFHIIAFKAQIEALAHAYMWHNDDDHTALDVAARWRIAAETLQECDTMPELQFRQLQDCLAEYSRDNGATWLPLYSGYACAMKAIDDALANGVIAPVSQQKPGGTVPLNECHTYRFQLGGGDIWVSPVPVTDGYTITVESAEGEWSDNNTLFSNWYCPDGGEYGFGYCGDLIPAMEGDPLQTANHMSLIGQCNGIYMPMYNTDYIVPNGTGVKSFFLQANDGSLEDNKGSIVVKVTICNYTVWCYTWDFTAVQGPFTGIYGGETWAVGIGWQTASSGGSQIGGPVLNAQTPFILTEMTVDYENTGQDAFDNQLVGRFGGGQPYTYQFLPDQSTGTHSYTWNLGDTGVMTAQVQASMDCAGLATHNIVKRITVKGTGYNPFGLSNC